METPAAKNEVLLRLTFYAANFAQVADNSAIELSAVLESANNPSSRLEQEAAANAVIIEG